MRDLRKLPDGWRVVRLGDIATVLTGTTPPREKLDFYGGGIPWLKPSDLARSQFVSTSAEYLTNDGASLARLVPKDTVLVSCIGTIGEVSISRVAMCFNQQINALIPGSLITSSFLYWSCASRADYMERIAAKTAVPILNKSEFSKIPIMLPPLNEQRAIAAVLDAIDEAIERTEAVISATERLRDALLHELLTRGVPGWHSEWQDVRGLGTVPADWQVMPLGDFATLKRGVDLPVQARAAGPIPVYGSNGVLGSHAKPLHPGPGVITGRSGSIGMVFFSSGPYWPLNTTLYVQDFHGNNARFIFYLLTHIQLEKFAASTSVPSLNRNFVHPIPVAVPPRHEQHRIAGAVIAVDKSLNEKRVTVHSLNSLKEAVSKVLLTGQRRFPGQMKAVAS